MDDRWKELYGIWASHTDDHILVGSVTELDLHISFIQ